jgi:hypothetical protein
MKSGIMDTDNTQDDAEPSPASAGSHGEPVAWLIHCGDEWQMVSLFREHADAAADENDGEVVPLYRSPALTDREREAIEESIQFAFPASHPTATTLRNLLQRTK